MKQTLSEREQQESWAGKYLTKENLAKATAGALALGTAVALTNPTVRQGIRAAQSTLSSNTIRAPGLEVASNASLRDRYQAAWAREQARQRQ